MNKLIQIVESKLSKHRLEHTLRVRETALKLAARYGASTLKVEKAALLHDICKEEPISNLVSMIESDTSAYGDTSVIGFNMILHGPAGAIWARDSLEISDTEILDAICYHTVGKPGMSLLSEIIFIADYIEPGRCFDGVEKVRLLAQRDIKEAIFVCLEQTIAHLLQGHKPIYEGTIHTYNYYLAYIKEKGPHYV